MFREMGLVRVVGPSPALLTNPVADGRLILHGCPAIHISELELICAFHFDRLNAQFLISKVHVRSFAIV